MKLLSLVLATALVTSAAVAVSAPAHAVELTPRGGALVSVSGGTATAKPIGDDRYTLIFPREADITWFGAAKGRGSTPQIGTFTPNQMTKGWTALGHRKGVGVAASLVWQQADGETSVVVLASDPRVRADGSLALKVYTQQALPAELPDYLITVTRAPKASRSFPVSGRGTQVYGSTYVSTTADSANATAGKIYTSTRQCAPYNHTSSLNAKLWLGPFVCGQVSINDMSYVVITQAAPGQCGSDRFSLNVVTSNASMTLSLTDLTWDVNGNAISAGGSCS